MMKEKIDVYKTKLMILDIKVKFQRNKAILNDIIINSDEYEEEQIELIWDSILEINVNKLRKEIITIKNSLIQENLNHDLLPLMFEVEILIIEFWCKFYKESKIKINKEQEDINQNIKNQIMIYHQQIGQLKTWNNLEKSKIRKFIDQLKLKQLNLENELGIKNKEIQKNINYWRNEYLDCRSSKFFWMKKLKETNDAPLISTVINEANNSIKDNPSLPIESKTNLLIR